MNFRSKSSRVYSAIIAGTFIAGLSPFLFNVVIDPYELSPIFDLDIEKEKISEKSHYPLWKVIHYPQQTAETVILGDSRARALKEKFWHQIGLTNTYNFAYGGATIFEIFDTFQFVKQSPNLKTLIVGIQLRSFDLNHKNGMNRVPEALRLSSNRFTYYSNWFVSRISTKLLEKKYEEQLHSFRQLNFSPVSSARADETRIKDRHAYLELLDEELCRNCKLPSNVTASPYTIQTGNYSYYFGRGLGRWGRLWPEITTAQPLTGVFGRQVRKNARSDWNKFEFSEELWSRIVQISDWSRENNVKLVFVIPPTIAEMQQRIVDFGFGELNHEFRLRLARLAPVFDFDFYNPTTSNLKNFSDAYHFNYLTAKQMIGEISLYLSKHGKVRNTALKRRDQIICPLSEQETRSKITDQTVEVLDGQSCRIWRTRHGS